MTTITIQEAQAKLLELIHGLAPGDQVLITENNEPVALLSIAAKTRPDSLTNEKRDWWAAIQKIELGQKLRGFVGDVSDADREDQGYDSRMNDIYKNTMPRDRSS